MRLAKVRSRAREIVRLATYFLMAISMHSDPLSPSHNSAIRKSGQSLYQRRGDRSHWTFCWQQIIFVFTQMSGLSRWCFPLFFSALLSWGCGPTGPSFFLSLHPLKTDFTTSPFLSPPQCLLPPSSFFFILICHCRLAIRAFYLKHHWTVNVIH